jgi:hypothetical protein
VVEPVRPAARDLAAEVARRYLDDMLANQPQADLDHLRDIAKAFTDRPDPALLAAARHRVAQQIAAWKRQLTPDNTGTA